MKSLLRILVSAALLAAAGLSTALAAEGTIELRTVAETELEVVNEEGVREILREEAATVVPGDDVIFTIHFANVGSEPAENVVITDQIPEHMLFRDLEGGYEGALVTISVDGGGRYDLPGNLVVTDDQSGERPAEAHDYTHLRWTLPAPVAPGEKGFVVYRAQLQ